jgi:hypothetical protein
VSYAYDAMDTALKTSDIRKVASRKVQFPKFSIHAKKPGQNDPVLGDMGLNKTFTMKRTISVPKGKKVLGFYVTFNNHYDAYTRMDPALVSVTVNGGKDEPESSSTVECFEGNQRVFVPYLEEGGRSTKTFTFEYQDPGDYYSKAKNFKIEVIYADETLAFRPVPSEL